MSSNTDHAIPERFDRHRGPVTCAAGIPNSSGVITSGYDGAVAIFDTETRAVDLLGYHAHLVNRVSVDRQGRYAASCSSDFNIYLWNLQTCERTMILRGHSDDVEDFVFINDRQGASVSRDWRVMVWDLESGAITQVLLGHAQDVLSISYLDGRLYTSGDDMTLRVWDLSTGALLNTWGPFANEADTCAIDPLHKRVILGCDDGKIRIFDIGSGELAHEICAHRAGIKKVAASPANGDILSAAYDQQIRVWDANTLTLKNSLEHQAGTWERSFNWSPDGARVYAGTFDGTVLQWDCENGRCEEEYGGQPDPDNTSTPGNACFNDVALTGDDGIALVSDDGCVRIGRLSAARAQWDDRCVPRSGRVLMNAVTAASDGGEIVVGAHDQSLYRFSPKDGALRETMAVRLGRGPVNCVRIARHPDYAGQYFVACYTGVVLRLDRDGAVLGEIHVHDNAVKSLALHPSRSIGVSCSADGVLAAWDFNGKLLREYPGHLAIIDDVDIDPSGERIASVGRDFSLKIHGLDDGRLYHNISLGRRSPKAVAFLNPDIVIVTNYWGELLRVNLSNGHVTRRPIAQNGISAIASRDDELVVSSYDGAVYLVNEHDLTTVNTLRGMTQRLAGSAFMT